MRRINRLLTFGASLLLLIALCVPVLSGALAAVEETPLVVPISDETMVFGADGAQIGTLRQDPEKGIVLVLTSGEEFAGIQVIFDQAAANNAETNDALTGKTLVLFSAASATTTSETTPEPVLEVIAEATPVAASETVSQTMPTQGWIDVNIIVDALVSYHESDVITIASMSDDIALKNEKIDELSYQTTQTVNTTAGKATGIFSAENTSGWVPVAAIALGVLGLGVLVWIAVSVSASAWGSERTVRQLTKLNERISDGLPLKTPVRIEQIAWPREGHVKLAPDIVEQLTAVAGQNGAYNMRVSEPVKIVEPEPEPIPEGEEPDLLQLANKLAGVAAAVEWHAIVKDAGWRAVLLQVNPTEKGTYIADDSGYSIIACLMRTLDAEIGYVLPSYQDPNASEPRWGDFYALTENTSVRNFRVDAMPVMYIERGTFFLPKSKGKLTRRPQQF